MDSFSGYYTVATDTYVPVKFAGSEISIENGNAGTSSTSLSVNGFPADYVKTYLEKDVYDILKVLLFGSITIFFAS